MQETITVANTYCSNNKFTFIGISHEFTSEKINWNYHGYGKLWNYNLTYFDFLQQKDINKTTGLKLIETFIYYDEPIRGKRMPFPISLRNINFIKFLSRLDIKNKKVDAFIFAQYQVLIDNIEYHILGNHLLENAFSLLFGAYYFQDEKLYKKASKILKEELEEQILKDGAHFELTPMYHQIMLQRILDCINLIQNNNWKTQELLSILKNKAILMLGWLETITYKNGEIPLFNDSSKGIAPTSKEIFKYAKKLNLKYTATCLSESGYRKRVNNNYECIIDVGNIGPDYIPGHAHSDTFNFELLVNKQPIIIDTGLSTYETNQRRTLERSTSSHNTVEINGANQTTVWGGFRVAERAKIIDLKESKSTIVATHNGYQTKGYLHTRKWEFLEKAINITDIITGKDPKIAISYLHFHPNIHVKIEKNLLILPTLSIEFSKDVKINKSQYNYASNFNQLQTSTLVKIEFNKVYSMHINIH